MNPFKYRAPPNQHTLTPLANEPTPKRATRNDSPYTDPEMLSEHPHPSSTSTFDLLIPKPHLRLTHSHLLLPPTPTMPSTRTAEEADLDSDNNERVPVRARTAELSDKDVDELMSDSTLNLDVVAHIPPPATDPLQIQGWDTYSTMENLNSTQISKWNEETGAKLLAYKASGGKLDGREDIKKLRDILTERLNLKTPPVIAPPSPEHPGGGKNLGPFCSLIKGIPPVQVQELERTRFISTPELTVFFIPLPQPAFHFVTMLMEFFFIDETDRESELEVAKFVGETLFPTSGTSKVSTAIRRIVADHRDNIPAPIRDVDSCLRYLRASIEVKRLNILSQKDIGTGLGQSYPAWNVYICPPTNDHLAMKKWRETIRDTTFATFINGTGSTVKLFKCTICRGIDHPTGMCPFPNQPGWVKNSPDISPAIDAILNANQDNDGARGPRPNTRARGATHTTRGRSLATRGNRGTTRNK